MSKVTRVPRTSDVDIKSPLDVSGDLRTAIPSITQELLSSILLESKVHSIYLHQLPLVLNEGTNYEDDPETIREELSKHEK